MNEQTTHTPTPWCTMPPTDTCMVHRIFGGTRYIGLVGNSDNHDHADAVNAAHIVRCVNAHDGLVKALRFIANVACGERQCKSEAICSLRAAGIEVTP